MDNNINLIDDYLTGNLNADQLISFEKKLISNPEVGHEVDLQKKIIEGIQESRKFELKSRLNALEVSTQNPFNWKKITIAASALLLTGSIAVYISNSTQEDNKIDNIVLTSEAAITSPKKDTKSITILPLENPVVVKSTKPETIVNSEEEIKKEPVSQKKAPASLENALPTMLNNDHDITIDNDLDSDAGIAASSVKFSEAGIKVFPENKKNRFHYKYDGKNVLVQIADYTGDIPAVLIDYPEKKEVFLNYKGVFYQLDSNKTWDLLSNHIITNEKLIKTLDQKIK